MCGALSAVSQFNMLPTQDLITQVGEFGSCAAMKQETQIKFHPFDPLCHPAEN